jgi:hypothetical protein
MGYSPKTGSVQENADVAGNAVERLGTHRFVQCGYSWFLAITASLHRKRLAHDSFGRVSLVARRFRLGGKKEAAGVAVAVILTGIMDIEYDLDFR